MIADEPLPGYPPDLHPITVRLIRQLILLDERFRALADAEQIDVVQYVSRQRIVRSPEIRVR